MLELGLAADHRCPRHLLGKTLRRYRPEVTAPLAGRCRLRQAQLCLPETKFVAHLAFPRLQVLRHPQLLGLRGAIMLQARRVQHASRHAEGRCAKALANMKLNLATGLDLSF